MQNLRGGGKGGSNLRSCPLMCLLGGSNGENPAALPHARDLGGLLGAPREGSNSEIRDDDGDGDDECDGDGGDDGDADDDDGQ
eukprot:2999874-Pyramimonas_sp.AAC.1